jgi:hypothetical protein
LYFQKSEFEAPFERDAMLRRALKLARAQHSRALEARILAAVTQERSGERFANARLRKLSRSGGSL